MQQALRRIGFLFIFLLLGLLAFTPLALAKIISSEDAVTIGVDEVVDDDLFIGAETVTIEGTVNGDVYVGGGMVNIKGTINGDVFAAGGMLDITGTIKDDLRVAGGNITIHEARIGDNLTVFGGNVSVDEKTKIGGSVVFGSGLFVSKAEVGKSILGGGGAVTINGKVDGDVQIGVGELEIGTNAKITGDLIYTSDEEAKIDEKAEIDGEVKKVLPPKAEAVTKDFPGMVRGVTRGVKVWSYLSTLLIGFILLYFARQPSTRIATSILERPWSSLGWGLVALFMTGPVLFLLALTVIGIPLAVILGGVFMLALYLAKIFIGILFGRLLTDLLGYKQMKVYLSFALGLAIYFLLTALPIIGFFILTASCVFGLGALFTFTRDRLVQ